MCSTRRLPATRSLYPWLGYFPAVQGLFDDVIFELLDEDKPKAYAHSISMIACGKISKRIADPLQRKELTA